ncbi:MAG: hypothetical protein HQK53_10470 [Oligoflexia bacterium]|nr:hypothetical protein [Oligoflexia bacterium]
MKRERRVIWFFLCLLLCLLSGVLFLHDNVWALIRFEDATYPELVTNSRALAMGNAFISRADDSSSPFYNPAGLGSVRGAHFHLSNFHVESNKDLISLTTGGSVFSVGSSVTKGLDLDGTRQLLLENRGRLAHARLNASPNLTTRYLSMGYLFSLQRRATIGQEDDAKFEFAFRQDHGPFWGLSLGLFGGVIKFGASVVYLDRKEIIDERDRNSVVKVQQQEYRQGRAWIVTGGARVVFPFTWLPTISGNIHNMLSSEFSSMKSGPPDRIRESIDVGFSLTPQLAKFVRVHLEANYKDATKKFPEVGATRRAMAGMELDLGRVLFLRVGYGDGFGSGGIGFRARTIEFDLATYAVDTTSNEFRGKEDRRFALTISAGI